MTFVGDPAQEMYKQATLGDVDFITGDYLAGMSFVIPYSSLSIDWLIVQRGQHGK
jgi:hypothetical protein